MDRRKLPIVSQMITSFPVIYSGLDANLAGGFYPGMMAYSPEQMQWMQHLYAQQMAQFMQV